MKERPIIFSGESVRAILDGRKTQTRRVVTVPWTRRTRTTPYSPYYEDADGVLMEMDEAGHYHPLVEVMTSPFGRPGDRLWVRESVRITSVADDDGAPLHDPPVWYEADGECPSLGDYRHVRPSIHMPRWASRITLEVVSVRVERLHAIGDAGVVAEGIGPCYGDFGLCDEDCRRAEYRATWNRLNAKRGHPWDSNPWVWVVEFKRIEDER